MLAAGIEILGFLSTQVSADAAECGQAFLAQGENVPAHLTLHPHFPVWWKRSSKSVVY